MYNINDRLQFRRFNLNTNSAEDSADNIIKKYTRPRKYIESNYNNCYNRPIPHLENSYYPLSGTHQTKKVILDDDLYNFITSCCREEIKKEMELKLSEKSLDDSNERYESDKYTTLNQKEYVDKSTYCRHMVDFYDQEVVNRALERNARLRRMIRKLVTAHHRQMQNEAWNNFINELKNKHGNYSTSSRRVGMNGIPRVFEDQDNISDFIDDCYNTKYSCKHSNLCESLLEDIYEVPYQTKMCTNYKDVSEQAYKQFTTSLPKASLGHLFRLEKEQERMARMKDFGIQVVGNNTRNTQNTATQRHDYKIFEPLVYQDCKHTFTNLSMDTYIQTDYIKGLTYSHTTHKDCATDYREAYSLDKDSKNVTVTKQPLQQQYMNELSLKQIENKLETVIDSFNSFIKEIKPKQKSKNIRHATHINVICKECSDVKKELVKKYNEDFSIDTEKLNSSDSILVNEIRKSPIKEYNNSNADITKLNEIFKKELGEESFVSNKTCAVQFAFEAPTRERSTEVTKSLSQAWKQLDDDVEDIIVSRMQQNEHMTIAVNTDPLSFLALLKISSEAMKRLLSYVPNFDYYYYLSRLQFPQLPRLSIEQHFICNICGASFKKPSDLNDHIQDHKLGESKNCSICRHVLENLGRKSRLFSCRHCGQCFTRAYCCELHQDTCAKNLGKKRDEDPDLLLLR